MPLWIAHYFHRYPPALGGSEAYFKRLVDYQAHQSDHLIVRTTTAIDLEAIWSRGFQETEPGVFFEQRRLFSGVELVRHKPKKFPARRYVLKALSMIPIAPWQALTMPCSPLCFGMFASTRYAGPLDLVHTGCLPYTGPMLAAYLLARRRQVPFLITPFLHVGDLDDPNDPVRRQFTSRPIRWLLKQADLIFAQTSEERDVMIGLGVHPRKVVVQGLGVDAAEVTGGDRNKARSAWQLDDNCLAVGHLANLSAEKGSIDLLKALEQIPRDGPAVKLILAGPEMPNFTRFWQTYPHKDRVVKLGPLSDEERKDFYAGIDCFALPSRVESFGLVLLEAWANGKPVIAYKAGGPSCLVRHGVDGFLIPTKEPELLPVAIQEYADYPTVRAEHGKAGQERIPQEFTWKRSLQFVQDSITRLVRQQSFAQLYAEWKRSR